jgi:hypothetical protein
MRKWQFLAIEILKIGRILVTYSQSTTHCHVGIPPYNSLHFDDTQLIAYQTNFDIYQITAIFDTKDNILQYNSVHVDNAKNYSISN